MNVYLEKQDYAIALGGVVLAIVSGFLVALIPQKAPIIDLATNYVPSLVMLVGLIFIVLGRRHFGGQLARCLEVVGVATAVLMISWIPHFIWHVLGMTSLLGISPGFWLTFFHVLTASAFVLYMYGFYLLSKAGSFSPTSQPTPEPASEQVTE